MCFCWLSGVVWISDRVQLTEVHMVSDYFGLHRFRGLWRMLSYWFGVFQSLPVWDRAESWKGHGPPASSVALERVSRVVWWTKPFTFPKHSKATTWRCQEAAWLFFWLGFVLMFHDSWPSTIGFFNSLPVQLAPRMVDKEEGEEKKAPFLLRWCMELGWQSWESLLDRKSRSFSCGRTCAWLLQPKQSECMIRCCDGSSAKVAAVATGKATFRRKP